MTEGATLLAGPTAHGLLPLVDRVPALAASCRHHADEAVIDAAVLDWAAASGLVGRTTRVKMRAARFGGMAARAFPETPRADVVLFGQWLVWLFAFDDLRDDGPLGRDEGATDRLYAEITAALDDRPDPAAHPVVTTFADLWARTAGRASPGWQATFRAHLAEHRAACRSEARHRRAGRPPSIDEYADLRRHANGPFMFDLAEPILRARVPDELRAAPAWQELFAACNDVTAWCNDVASAAKEQACGDVHNFVLVLAAGRGVSLGEATAEVLDRIETRMADLAAAARALPGDFRRLGLPQPPCRDASRVAVTLLGAPRGHLEWLLESARYG
ncbi:MAG: hypothetical protein HOV79_02760 [Hamadaea sp.]|nr:hypothetical protein [Hamadaea sp.]